MELVRELVGMKVRANNEQAQERSFKLSHKFPQFSVGEKVIVKRIPIGKFTFMEDGEKKRQ